VNRSAVRWFFGVARGGIAADDRRGRCHLGGARARAGAGPRRRATLDARRWTLDARHSVVRVGMGMDLGVGVGVGAYGRRHPGRAVRARTQHMSLDVAGLQQRRGGEGPSSREGQLAATTQRGRQPEGAALVQARPLDSSRSGRAARGLGRMQRAAGQPRSRRSAAVRRAGTPAKINSGRGNGRFPAPAREGSRRWPGVSSVGSWMLASALLLLPPPLLLLVPCDVCREREVRDKGPGLNTVIVRARTLLTPAPPPALPALRFVVPQNLGER
jgi:hypothetical protein